MAFRATEAKASLISISPRSWASLPAFFNAFCRAMAGTVCSQAYRSALMPWATISASGVTPSCSARSRSITTTAAPPSEICDAFPAVIVPSFWNTGLSLASDSSVASARIPSSVETTTGSPLRWGISKGTTSSAKRPDVHAWWAR